MRTTARTSRRRTLGAASLALLGLAVLAPLSLALALVVAPSLFEVESSCFGALGVEGSDGDTSMDAGAIGWLVVFIAVLFAQIAERTWTAVTVALAWSGTYVLGTTAAAAVIGPAPCPG